MRVAPWIYLYLFAAPLYGAFIPIGCFDASIPTLSQPIKEISRQPNSIVLALPDGLRVGRDILNKVRYLESTTGQKLVAGVDMGNKLFIHDATDGKLIFAGQFFAEKDGVLARINDFAKAPDRDFIAIAGEKILAVAPLYAKAWRGDFGRPEIFDTRAVDKYLNISNCEEFNYLKSPMRVEWSADGRLLVTSAKLDQTSGSVRIWDPAESDPTKQMVVQFKTKNPLLINDSANVGFSADRTILYAVTTRGVEFFDINSRKPISDFTLPTGDKLLGISMSGDLRTAAVTFSGQNKNAYAMLIDLVTLTASHFTFLGDRYVNVKNVHLDLKKNKILIGYGNIVATIPLDGTPSKLVLLGQSQQILNVYGGEFAQEPASFINSEFAINSGPKPLVWKPSEDGFSSQTNSITTGDEIRIYRLD